MLFFGTLANDLVEPGKGTTADEQHIAGINLQELLLRMFAATLRRDRRNGTFNQLQQRLLNTLTGNIPVMDGLSDLREILSISSM